MFLLSLKKIFNGEVDSFVIKDGTAISTFLNLYVSYGSATKFLRNGEKYYIYFIDSLLLFPRVKQISKSVNS